MHTRVYLILSTHKCLKILWELDASDMLSSFDSISSSEIRVVCLREKEAGRHCAGNNKVILEEYWNFSTERDLSSAN